MNELEKMIYDSFLSIKDKLIKKAESIETKCKYIVLPFRDKTNISFAIYDTLTKKFCKIKYYYEFKNDSLEEKEILL